MFIHRAPTIHFTSFASPQIRCFNYAIIAIHIIILNSPNTSWTFWLSAIRHKQCTAAKLCYRLAYCCPMATLNFSYVCNFLNAYVFVIITFFSVTYRSCRTVSSSIFWSTDFVLSIICYLMQRVIVCVISSLVGCVLPPYIFQEFQNPTPYFLFHCL